MNSAVTELAAARNIADTEFVTAIQYPIVSQKVKQSVQEKGLVSCKLNLVSNFW